VETLRSDLSRGIFWAPEGLPFPQSRGMITRAA
jgi:hypothetical protein